MAITLHHLLIIVFSNVTTDRKPKANIHIMLELLSSFEFEAITNMQTIFIFLKIRLIENNQVPYGAGVNSLMSSSLKWIVKPLRVCSGIFK